MGVARAGASPQRTAEPLSSRRAWRRVCERGSSLAARRTPIRWQAPRARPAVRQPGAEPADSALRPAGSAPRPGGPAARRAAGPCCAGEGVALVDGATVEVAPRRALGQRPPPARLQARARQPPRRPPAADRAAPPSLPRRRASRRSALRPRPRRSPSAASSRTSGHPRRGGPVVKRVPSIVTALRRAVASSAIDCQRSADALASAFRTTASSSVEMLGVELARRRRAAW